MKLLVVTGIFPPDSGGPASYVPRMAEALCCRGHRVEVVTLSDSLEHDDAARPFRVHRIGRSLFKPWRMLVTVCKVWRLSRSSDLVYVNGLGSEAALGALLAGRPTVHKIVGDYAWERARSKQWFAGTLDEYQAARKGIRLRTLDLVRTVPLRFAKRIITPSDYLRRIVTEWRIPREKIAVIYNAVPSIASSTTEPPALPPFDGKTLTTVCRLVPWKGLDA